MNATSLYVTTNLIILKAKSSVPSTWQDLYRLVPYLKNSLCCVVCGNLLLNPLTPMTANCQHHVCKKCKGGRKKIKPTCLLCKDCTHYDENRNLKILLQCYKQMCTYLMNGRIFQHLQETARNPPESGVERGAGNLLMLIKEGAAFQDEYESKGGLPKSTYNILPCVYTNSSTQTLQAETLQSKQITAPSSLYSVMSAGGGNKITIKRKLKEKTDSEIKLLPVKKTHSEKKPSNKSTAKPKRGCRCGNATVMPGKLTCCGQRCPCYVESKPCIECKCRGCRNPHRADGLKVRPHIPEIQQQVMQTPHSQSVLEDHLLRTVVQVDGLDPHFTSFEDTFGSTFKTYKVLAESGCGGLNVSANSLFSGSLLPDDDEDAEISVDV